MMDMDAFLGPCVGRGGTRVGRELHFGVCDLACVGCYYRKSSFGDQSYCRYDHGQEGDFRVGVNPRDAEGVDEQVYVEKRA